MQRGCQISQSREKNLTHARVSRRSTINIHATYFKGWPAITHAKTAESKRSLSLTLSLSLADARPLVHTLSVTLRSSESLGVLRVEAPTSHSYPAISLTAIKLFMQANCWRNSRRRGEHVCQRAQSISRWMPLPAGAAEAVRELTAERV